MKHLFKSAIALMIICSCIFAFAGCGDKEQNASTDKSADFDKTILGEKTEGEYAYAIELTNSTGYDIINFAARLNGEATFSRVLLPEGDTYAAGETRTLYFDTEFGYEYWASISTGEEEPVTPSFDMQMTLRGAGYSGGDLIVTIHQFPFGDITKGELKLADKVVYLQYSSAVTGEAVSTLETEQMIEQGNLPIADPMPVVTEDTQTDTGADKDNNSANKNNNNSNKNKNNKNNKNNNSNNNNNGNNNNNNENNNNNSGNNNGGDNTQGGNNNTGQIDYGEHDGGCIDEGGLVY